MKYCNENYIQLIESLQLLACEYDFQKKVLPDFVCAEDEIDHIFDKGYGSGRKIQEKINVEAFNVIKQIHDRFEELSETEAMWKEGALAKNDEWEKFRVLASKAIKLLGEKIELPKLDWRMYDKDVRRVLAKKGKVDIIPDISEEGCPHVTVIGDPDGLRYLARLFNWLADVNQEEMNMPDGEREHIHLHAKCQLGSRSCEVELCRADAKGTGELPDFMRD